MDHSTGGDGTGTMKLSPLTPEATAAPWCTKSVKVSAAPGSGTDRSRRPTREGERPDP